MPNKICLTVMVGTHALSSLRMLRHTVPDGKTFGWKMVGVNLPVGTGHRQPSQRRPRQCDRRMGAVAVARSRHVHKGGRVG